MYENMKQQSQCPPFLFSALSCILLYVIESKSTRRNKEKNAFHYEIKTLLTNQYTKNMKNENCFCLYDDDDDE